jgi:hypothetical protein
MPKANKGLPLPGLLSLPQPHRSLASIISRARNHSLRSEGIAKTICKKPAALSAIPKTIPWKGSITHFVQCLGNTSRATRNVLYHAMGRNDDDISIVAIRHEPNQGHPIPIKTYTD